MTVNTGSTKQAWALCEQCSLLPAREQRGALQQREEEQAGQKMECKLHSANHFADTAGKLHRKCVSFNEEIKDPPHIIIAVVYIFISLDVY